MSWSPWHQDRPRIRARVINPDGQAYDFDPGSLIEGSEGGNQNTGVYSDLHTLNGPYPQAHIGSVIEEEIVLLSRPILDSGGFIRDWDFYSRRRLWSIA